MEAQSATDTAATSARLSEFRARIGTILRTPLYANAFYLWVNAAGTALAGFAFWALVARLYDAHDVGLGSAALSLLTLLTMFSHLGLGLGLIRFLPECGVQRPRLANVVFTASAIVAALSSAVFLIGISLWAPSLGFLREQPLHSVAFLSFVVVGTFALVQTYAFVAIRKAKYVLVQFVFLHMARLALPAVMAAFFGPFGIVASGGIAMALAAAVGFALLRRGLPSYRPALLFDRAIISRVLPFSAASYVTDLLLLSPGLILPLIVVSLLGSAEGAYFYMAWFLGFLLTSASTYLALSLFAEGSHDPGALRLLSRNAIAGAVTAATLGGAFLLVLGDKMLLAFGHDYATEGATLLRIMAVAALPAAVVNVYVGALRVMKRTVEMVIIAGLVAATTVALSSALLPVVGLAGAGVGHGVGQGLGLTIVLARLLASLEGPMRHKIRWLVVTLAGRS